MDKTQNTKKDKKDNEDAKKEKGKKDAKKENGKKGAKVKNEDARDGSRKRKLFQTTSGAEAFDRALSMIPTGSTFARVKECLKRGKALALVKHVKHLRTKLLRAERELAQVQKEDRAHIKRVKITKVAEAITKPTKTRSTTASLTRNDRREYLALCEKHGLTKGTWDIPPYLRIDPVVNRIAEKLEAVRRASKVTNVQQRTQGSSAPSSIALSNSSLPDGSSPTSITKAP